MSGICAIWRKDNAHVSETLSQVSRGLAPAGMGRIEQRCEAGAGVALCAAFPRQQIAETALLVTLSCAMAAD